MGKTDDVSSGNGPRSGMGGGKEEFLRRLVITSSENCNSSYSSPLPGGREVRPSPVISRSISSSKSKPEGSGRMDGGIRSNLGGVVVRPGRERSGRESLCEGASWMVPSGPVCVLRTALVRAAPTPGRVEEGERAESGGRVESER